MSPFKGASWSEADRKASKESKKAEELKIKMQEHDYLECYCYALSNPPWGGYSVDEQIIYEIKQRNIQVDLANPLDTKKSRYSYRYANNALTGEIFVNEPFFAEPCTTTDEESVCIHAYPAKVDIQQTEPRVIQRVQLQCAGQGHRNATRC